MEWRDSWCELGARRLKLAGLRLKLSANFLELSILNAPYLVSFAGRLAILRDMLRRDPPIPEFMLMIHESLEEELSGSG